MSKEQLAPLKNLGVKLTFDKSLTEDFLDEEKDIFEGGFTFCQEGDLTDASASAKAWLSDNGFHQLSTGVVFKKNTNDDCRYHEGEIVIFGKKSIQFSMLATNLESFTTTLKVPCSNGAVSLKILAGWALYSQEDIDSIIKSNSDVFKLHLFQFFCKQVRKRGGGRDNNKTVAGISINPDMLYQSLIGVPVGSLSKRVYTHQSENAALFRAKISKAYKGALNSLIDEGSILKLESSEGLSLYRPITMSELRSKDKNFQRRFSEIYGTSYIS